MRQARPAATSPPRAGGPRHRRCLAASARRSRRSRRAEAFNGARYDARLARDAAADARRVDQAAQQHLAVQRDAFGAMIIGQAGSRPDLAALQSIVESDGFSDLLVNAASLGATVDALDARRTALTAAQERADATRAAADTTATPPTRGQGHRRAGPRPGPQRRGRRPASAPRTLAARKGALLDELARLQGVSVALATRRQAGLEQRAAARARPPRRRGSLPSRRRPSRPPRPSRRPSSRQRRRLLRQHRRPQLRPRPLTETAGAAGPGPRTGARPGAGPGAGAHTGSARPPRRAAPRPRSPSPAPRSASPTAGPPPGPTPGTARA